MSDSPVTELAELAAAWESIGSSLERRLRRAGVDAHTAADVAQEVACRAVARVVEGRGFTSRRGLLAWSHMAARNVAVDAWRRERTAERYVPLATAGDEYEVVEWRDLLRRTLDAASTLTPAQRAALAALIDGRFPDDKRDQVRESVQRLRARERLRRAVGRLPVLWPSRRWLRWAGPAGATAASVVVGLVLVPTAPAARVATSDAPVVLPLTTVPVVHAVTAAVAQHPEHIAPLPRLSTPPVIEGATTSTTVRVDSRRRVPLTTVTAPTSEVEVGTRPDRGHHVVCVDTDAAGLCVAKPRRLLEELAGEAER